MPDALLCARSVAYTPRDSAHIGCVVGVSCGMYAIHQQTYPEHAPTNNVLASPSNWLLFNCIDFSYVEVPVFYTVWRSSYSDGFFL